MPIKIVIADDHKIVRQGLRALLSCELDMMVVAEADDGRSVLPLVQEFSPDVVIMDISMPGLNGIDATGQIIVLHPEVKVIGLSMHSDSFFVLNMFKAGASAYLVKDCTIGELIKAIHAVMDHKTYLSLRISDVVINNFFGREGTAGGAVSTLTDREREVLQFLAEGKTNHQIAEALGVSVKTVESHRKRIMEKSGMHSLAQLTKYAIRQGLTSLEE